MVRHDVLDARQIDDLGDIGDKLVGEWGFDRIDERRILVEDYISVVRGAVIGKLTVDVALVPIDGTDPPDARLHFYRIRHTCAPFSRVPRNRGKACGRRVCSLASDCNRTAKRCARNARDAGFPRKNAMCAQRRSAALRARFVERRSPCSARRRCARTVCRASHPPWRRDSMALMPSGTEHPPTRAFERHADMQSVHRKRSVKATCSARFSRAAAESVVSKLWACPSKICSSHSTPSSAIVSAKRCAWASNVYSVPSST